MRTTVVTGATSGVGFAIALDQLRRGHAVVATGRNSTRLEQLRAAAEAEGAAERLVTVEGDLGSIAKVRTLADEATRHSGGSIDAVIHAAFGHIGEDAGVSIADVEVDDLNQFLQDSVMASLLVAKAFVPVLAGGHGRFVFVVADWGLPQHNVLLSGISGDGAIGSEAYVSAKYAVAGLANSLERLSRVRVSAIYPGVIASAAGEDVNGQPAYLSLNASEEEVAAAGYDVPQDAIPLSDLADAVEYVLSTRATVRSLVLKPARTDYDGL